MKIFLATKNKHTINIDYTNGWYRTTKQTPFDTMSWNLLHDTLWMIIVWSWCFHLSTQWFQSLWQHYFLYVLISIKNKLSKSLCNFKSAKYFVSKGTKIASCKLYVKNKLGSIAKRIQLPSFYVCKKLKLFECYFILVWWASISW